MHARVTTLHFKPGRAAEGLAAIDDTVARSMATAPPDRDAIGLVSVTRMRDPRDESVTVISIWRDRAALDASEEVGLRILGSAGDALVGPPQPRSYEVRANDPGQPKGWARVSSGRVTAEALAGRPDGSIRNAASQQPGYAGYLVLLDPESRDSMGMSFWDTEEHLVASEDAYYNREIEKIRGGFEGGAVQKAVYQVVDREF